jgi:ElaB/YqjD/DUF883 family membrane-anchored ribosome-binding protein
MNGSRFAPKRAMTDRILPAHAHTDPVLEHRRAVEETVEALKTKLTRATDKVEHARERMSETTDFLREHRWSAIGAVAVLGLVFGMRRRRSPPVQLLLPPNFEHQVVQEQKKKTLLGAAFATVGTLILREVGMRAIAILEDKLLRASNPPEPPLR